MTSSGSTSFSDDPYYIISIFVIIVFVVNVN
jgi:hypothetical protein